MFEKGSTGGSKWQAVSLGPYYSMARVGGLYLTILAAGGPPHPIYIYIRLERGPEIEVVGRGRYRGADSRLYMEIDGWIVG